VYSAGQMNVPSDNTNSSGYVATPCIRVCRLDKQQICTGCLRSAQEIQAWPDASGTERRQILEAVDRRAEQHRN